MFRSLSRQMCASLGSVPFFRYASLLLCALLLMQGSRMDAQGVQRQSWTTEDGLPQNSVHALLQASDGFLWVATEAGAARFDGVRFDRYTSENTPAFSSNDLCCIVQTADTAIYFGMSDGVVRLLHGRFERVAAETSPTLAMQRNEDGSLLVLTADALLRVEALQGKVEPLPDGLQAAALGRDEHGGSLVAAGTVLLHWVKNTWVRERTLPVAPLDFFVAGEDVWLRTRSQIVALSPSGERRWHLGKELPGSRLDSLLGSSEGAIAGTNRGTFVLRSGKSEAVPLAQLEDATALSTLVDREGDRWFGTDTGGLIVLRQRAVLSVPELASETVTCVVAGADGTLWLGTRDSGLRTIRRGLVATPAASAKLGSQVVLSLAPDAQGGVWVGTPEGLDHIEGSRVLHFTSADGLPDDLVRSLLAEPDGSVWVGTRRGLARWSGGKIDRVLTGVDGLPSEIVGTLLRAANGDLWIGTLAGLGRLRAGTGRVEVIGGAVSGKAITGLAETQRGALWISTRSSGLFVWRNGHAEAVHVPGLPSTIHALLPDAAGRLWMRTSSGLAQAKVSTLASCAGQATCDIPIRQYGTADGMGSVDASFDGHPAAWATRDGILWFASRRGVSSVDAAHLPVDVVSPPVVIEQVRVNDVSVPFEDGVRLASGNRRLEISYAGLSLRAPLQVRYRFRLEGFDKNWTDAGSRRTAEYTNLPFGSYRLLVEARNADGILSPQPATLVIDVARPVYRRWWFYGLVVCAVAAIIYAVYWLRLRRVRREFAAVLGERNRIAREIHDTLAQDFVAVSLQLEVTAQLLRRERVEAAREQILSTSLLVRNGIRDARESIWALRAGDSAQSLPARLQKIVDTDAKSGTSCEVSVTGAYRVLPPVVEKEMLRIGREALGNALKHAKAHTIRVSLVYSDEAIILQVSDDGSGFDPEQGAARQGHFGLRGMRERAGGIGGVLTIESIPREGSTVRLHLPCR